jgi:hypothetical protein
MNMNKILLIIGLLLSVSVFGQQKAQLTEAQKIDLLISAIEKLEGAQFYRNGTWYDSATAASHLRMKREKAGNAIKTANDFINRIASSSSITGEAYKIRLKDGKEMLAKDYFTACLKEIESTAK